MKVNAQSNLNLSPSVREPIESEAGSRFVRSLRFKGHIFTVLLLSYITFITVFVLMQRHQPLEQLEQYQKIQKAQKALARADLAAFHIVTMLFSDVSQSDLQGVAHYFSSLRQQYINLQEWFPEQAESFRKLVETIPVTLMEPSERNLKQIHFHLAQSKIELGRMMSLNSARLSRLINEYRAHNDSVVMTTLILGIMGLALLGAMTSLFFNQLKSDLNALQKRTAEIVQGYRGEPLPVKRHDEVGQLTQGMNYMANALAEREQALEIQHGTTAFMEKMVAIDSLAGGIAHEIGNPITCIAGLAEEIKNDVDNQLSEDSQQYLAAMLKYVDGLVKVGRDLSVIDTHKRDEYEWLDIDQLISNTLNIFHYDKRWTNISINLNLDHMVPAIYASVNQITQLISNILENAMDAVQKNRQPVVTINTRLQDDEHLLISIHDKGAGMGKDVLEHIFDPFFSTKSVGLGTGLGLAICWTIAKAHHGSISATSVVSEGTEINIILPINQPGNTE